MASVPALANDTALPAEASAAQQHFALRQRQARMFAMSPLVPENLRKGTPEQAMANCYIALTLADAMGEQPLIVMQNIHVINGKAGFASKYMIARANASGKFKDDLDWEITGAGPTLSATCFATLSKTGKRVQMTVDMNMAKAEGWTKNAKYNTMPELMLRYRSASFLVNLYAPEVMLGYRTVEEYEDIGVVDAPAAEPVSAAALLEQATEDLPTVEPENVVEGPADEDRGEQHTATPSEDAEADKLIGFIETKTTQIDLNSLMADWKDKVLTWSDGNRDRVAEAQQKRVDAIRGEG